MTPPVAIASSSGCAWKMTSVRGIVAILARDGRGTWSPAQPDVRVRKQRLSLVLPGGCDASRLVAVLAVAVGLVQQVVRRRSAQARQEDFPAVDQPGVTDDRDQGRRRRVRRPTRSAATYADAFDGVKAYFDMVNAKGGIYGRDLELDVGARRPAGATTSRRSRRSSPRTSLRGAARRRRLLVHRRRRSSPTRGSRPSAGTSTRSGRARRTSSARRAPASTCTGCSVGLPCLAKETGQKKVGVLGVHRPSSRPTASTGIEKSFEKYPDGRDRVHRHEPVVRRHRLQRRGRPDEGRGRRPRHHLHGQQRRGCTWPRR